MKEKAYSSKRIVLTVLFLLASIILPYIFVSEEVVREVIESFMEGAQHIFNEDYTINVFALFYNNLRASLIMLFIGWIPGLFLPIFTLGLNGAIIGVALKLMKISGVSPWKMSLVGLLPHGIFEIPGLLISFLLGIFICSNISRRIFRRDSYKLRDVFKFTIKEFVIKVIPLLVVAALVETYITPIIISKFI